MLLVQISRDGAGCAAKNAIKEEVFADIEADKSFAEPNIICHFALGVGDPLYAPVKSW